MSKRLLTILLLFPFLSLGQHTIYTNHGHVLTNNGKVLTKGTAVAPFSPSDLPNLALWLKADAGVTKDGSNYVSSWADQSGNGNNVTQAAGSSQPLWVDNYWNNKPVLYFNEDWLTSTNNYITDPLIPSQPTTTFVVFNVVEAGVIIGSTNTSQRNQIGWLYAYAGELHSITASLLNTYTLSVCYNGVNSYMYLNGETGWIGNLGIQYLSDLQVGTLQNSGAYNFIGYISEIIMYSDAKDSLDRQLIETYLQTKYAHY